MAEDLISALTDLKEETVLEIARKRLDGGESPLNILNDARKGVTNVGQLYQKGEYFIPELVLSGEILKEIVEMVKPKLAAGVDVERLGRVVIGTVAGDIHDIGKDIVTFMLDVNGFEVFDLGVDVPAKEFVDKIKEVEPGVVGLSGFLTVSFDSMKETIQSIKDAGLRDRVKIMVGGGTLDDAVSKYVGADAFGRYATDAVSLAKQWIGGK